MKSSKTPRFIRNTLRFLLRFKWLLRFGQWLLRKQPRISSRLLKMADLTTPYVPSGPLRFSRSAPSVEKLTESARSIYEALKAAVRDPQAGRNGPAEGKSRLAVITPQPPGKSTPDGFPAALPAELALYYAVTPVSLTASAGAAESSTLSLTDFKARAGDFDRRLYYFSGFPTAADLLAMSAMLRAFPGTVILPSLSTGGFIPNADDSGLNPKTWCQALYRAYGYPPLIDLKNQRPAAVLCRYPLEVELGQSALGVILNAPPDPSPAENPAAPAVSSWQRVILPGRDPAALAAAYRQAIEEFAQKHPLALRQRRIAQIALSSGSAQASSNRGPTRPLKERDLLAMAQTLAEEIPWRGPPQLLVDISVIAQGDSRTGIQRVTRSLLQQIMADPPPGYRVEPVYRSAGVYRYARRYMARFLDVEESGLPDDPAEAGQGDLFLGLDLAVDMEECDWDWLRVRAGCGLKIHFVMHDLLPLVMPHCFRPQVEEITRHWLTQAVSLADGMLCVSRYTARELGNWLTRHPAAREKPLLIGYFHHGADIAPAASLRLSESEAGFVAGLAGRVNILMVGTLEPRKAYAQALAAFENLWQAGEDVRLIIVGKIGWKTEALVKRLQHHPELGRRLFWFDQAGDDLLVELYRHSSALLMASEGEGFGLPLVEAARYELPLIVRDLEVFHEVVGDRAFYFRGQSPADLAAALKTWLTDYRQGLHPRSQGLRWQSWEESARQVLKVVLESDWLTVWDPEVGLVQWEKAARNDRE